MPSVSQPDPSPTARAPSTPGPARELGFAWLLATLAWPWLVHALLVLGSVLGGAPLSGKLVPAGSLLAAFVFAGWLARCAPVVAVPEPRGASDTLPLMAARCMRALQLAAPIAVLFPLLMAALLPIVAYDAIGYRLPVIAQWLDAGALRWVVSDDPVRNGYPMGQEAVSAVVGAALGTLRLAGTTSFVYVAQGAFAVAWLARVSAVRASLARACACLWLLTPMVILNAPSGYVDAAFAGASIALFCTAAVAFEAGASPLLALAAGMAAAHVLSLKGTGLPFVCVVVAAIGLRALLQRRAPPLRALLLFCLAASPGAFWTLRNLVHTGNPLWPIELRVAGHVLLPGVGSAEQILDSAHNTPVVLRHVPAVVRVLLTWLQWHGSALSFDYRYSGLGWNWPLLALPALCAASLRRLRPGTRPIGRDPLGFVLLLTAACLLLQPMTWWSRYTLWLWGAGALALASELQLLLWSGRLQWVQLALCVAACVGIGEGVFALAHVQGLDLLVYRHYSSSQARARPFTEQMDLQHASNAKRWIAAEFWQLGLPHDHDLCRGAWKPGTDNANLDGVFAQLSPRPAVHIVPDEQRSWPAVRSAFVAAGCRSLLLFRGSPVLPAAQLDPTVTVTAVRAFDPLFLVTLRR